MLKRPRAPSPSPTRAVPSSPPLLDKNTHIPFSKRRRTIGPIIDSNERRDHATVDDGEDDYEDAGEEENVDTSIPNGKVYEHVNHILHSLHAEHQHRARTAQPHSASYLPPSNSLSPSFLLHRDSHCSRPSPLSSPSKYAQEFQIHSPHNSVAQSLGHMGSRNGEELSPDSSSCVQIPATPSKLDYFETDLQDGERIRVTQRYEDTNKLLGSLVLSRRRTLRSPSVDFE
ncbi:hypothetical protein K439DRAFT_840090 [Ramaria rubella]|nr:hypothetical protein K439DRAFT_840090 [Ramaria rubella]